MKCSTFCLAALTLLMVGLGHARAGPLFTDAKKNASILEEAALTNHFLIGKVTGLSSRDPLDITSGTFNSSGWSFSLTGTYSGMPVALAFVGMFDLASNAGSFTSTGTIGSSILSGLGNWAWTDTSDVEEDLTYSISLTL